MKKLIVFLIFASLLACSKEEPEVLPQPNVVVFSSGGSYELQVSNRVARVHSYDLVPNCNSADDSSFSRFYMPIGTYAYSLYRVTPVGLSLIKEGRVTIRPGCNVIDLSNVGVWSDN